MNIGFEYIKYRWNVWRCTPSDSALAITLLKSSHQVEHSNIAKNNLNSLIDNLLENHQSISIADHGAGSKKLGQFRKISEIAKTSSSRGKYGDYLYALSSNLKPKSVLELGTSLGIGTINLKLGYPSSSITTVEGCPETHAQALKNFKSLNLDINAVNCTFSEYFQLKNNNKFDLVFIDGHHDGQALLDYLDLLQDRIHDKSVIILDDIRWSKSMLNTWYKLVNDNFYNLTIDLFRMGIIVPIKNEKRQSLAARI